MGIERFFNSLKKDFNIIKSIKPESNYIINSEYLFIDFNSIIHVVSQRINNIVDKLLVESLTDYNGCLVDGDPLDNFDLLHIEKPNFKFTSENDVIETYKQFFTIEKLDDIIINNVGLFLLNLFKRFDKRKIKLIYMSIDGVPSKAKMVEQKKRRFMGEFESNVKKQIIKKHKDDLNIEKSEDCNIPFNRYKYLTNYISWSRGAISPATYFMLKLSRYLSSIEFKNKVNKILPNISSDKLILSNFTQKNEGEKKIMDYINDNEINGNICILSPDADLILLSMILKNPRLKKYVLRNDQQKSEKILNTIDSHYDLICINNLEDSIFNYMDTSGLLLQKKNIIGELPADRSW